MGDVRPELQPFLTVLERIANALETQALLMNVDAEHRRGYATRMEELARRQVTGTEKVNAEALANQKKIADAVVPKPEPWQEADGDDDEDEDE